MIPQPSRTVLVWDIRARSQCGGDLRAGAIKGEEEDCGLAVVMLEFYRLS